MKDIISAKQLGKTYGDLTVLKGIDLNIKKGEIVAITGPSGAGKTSISKKLLQRDKKISLSISCTTRPKRKGEINKKDYIFI